MFESCLRNSEKLKPKGLGFFRYCFGKPLHMLQVAVLSPLRYESVPKGPSASPASATQRSSSQRLGLLSLCHGKTVLLPQKG